MKSVRISSSEEVLIRIFNKLVKNTNKLIKATNAYAFDKMDERWDKIEIFLREFKKTKPDILLIDFSKIPDDSIYRKIYENFNHDLRRQIEFTNEEHDNQSAYEFINNNHPGEIEKILQDAEDISKNIIAQWVYFEELLEEFKNEYKQLLNIDDKRINLCVNVATFNTDADKLAKGDIITKSNFLGNAAIDNDRLREKGFNGSLFLLCRLIANPSNQKYLEEFIQKREQDIASNKTDPLLEMGIHSKEELTDLLQKFDKINILMKRHEQKIRIGEIDSKLLGLKLDKVTAHENMLKEAKKELKDKSQIKLEESEKKFLKKKPIKPLKNLPDNTLIGKNSNTSRKHTIAIPLGHSRQQIVSSRQSSIFSPKDKDDITTRNRPAKITEIENKEAEELEKKKPNKS